MHLLSICLERGKAAVTAVKDHVQRNGKAYLVGTAMLVAAGVALHVNSHLEEEVTIRVGGGRVIAAAEFAGSSMRTYDPTPVLRRLAELIRN